MTAPFRRPQDSEWIRAYAQVQVATDQQILAMLREAQQTLRQEMAAVAGVSTTDAIRYQQMAIIRQSIMKEQAAVMRRLGQVVEARRLEASARAIQLGNGMDAYILDKLGRSALAREVAASLQHGLARTTQVALARMDLSYTALSQRIYNTDVWLGSRVDQQITAALARGLSAREFARQAEDWFSPDTPGGIRYASMRLARSEINNAFHAVSVQQVQDKPWVHAMKWHLSGSHPKADICDEYANEDKFDMGPGIFPKEEVPRKPHPHCYCYVTGVDIDDDEFLDALTSGKYDKWVEDQRAMASGVQPKLPEPAAVAKKAQAKSAPGPGESSSATRIKQAKVMFGDFEVNPALLGRMSLPDLKSLHRAYGGTGTGSRPDLIAGIKSKMPRSATAAPKTARATPAPKVAPKPATKAAPPKSVPSPRSAVAETRQAEVSARSAANQAQLEAALARQQTLAPNASGKLLKASEMTPAEQAEFRRRFGQDAVGGYMGGQYRLVFHPSVFTPKATTALRAEVRSGFSSRVGEGISGLDGTVAHEFGHHLSYLARVLGPQRTKAIWDTLADGAGVPRAMLYDQSSLDRWVARNADKLSKAVSRYGASGDADELLAEVWAEFSTNPEARAHIRDTAIALRDMAEEIAMML